METSREKAAGPEGRGSIRLRYSRQFQSGGHAHSVDAECLLPVGTSQETREQVVRELELSVEQLTRQITHQGARPVEATRPQTPTPTRPVQAPAAPETPPVRMPREPAEARPTTEVPRVPVSESMPTTPTTGNEGRTIRLPQFLKALNDHLKISPVEAMELLNVPTLDGLNYREAFNTLRAIIDRRNASTTDQAAQSNPSRSAPIVEAPRSTGRGSSPAPTSRPPSNQAINMTIPSRTHNQATPRAAQQAAPATAPVLEVAPPVESKPRAELEPGVDFAGSPKAPIPIQIGTVRDITPRAYKFEEEEDEEYELPDDEASAQTSGKLKLDELKEIRGSTAASAGRLKVLDNVLDSQISAEQLQKLLQAAWNITTTKKLKTDQVEALISWAKEDFFGEEVEAVLAWIAEEER